MTCNVTWDTWNTSAFLLHSSQWGVVLQVIDMRRLSGSFLELL